MERERNDYVKMVTERKEVVLELLRIKKILERLFSKKEIFYNELLIDVQAPDFIIYVHNENAALSGLPFYINNLSTDQALPLKKEVDNLLRAIKFNKAAGDDLDIRWNSTYLRYSDERTNKIYSDRVINFFGKYGKNYIHNFKANPNSHLYLEDFIDYKSLMNIHDNGHAYRSNACDTVGQSINLNKSFENKFKNDIAFPMGEIFKSIIESSKTNNPKSEYEDLEKRVTALEQKLTTQSNENCASNSHKDSNTTNNENLLDDSMFRTMSILNTNDCYAVNYKDFFDIEDGIEKYGNENTDYLVAYYVTHKEIVLEFLKINNTDKEDELLNFFIDNKYTIHYVGRGSFMSIKVAIDLEDIDLNLFFKHGAFKLYI